MPVSLLHSPLYAAFRSGRCPSRLRWFSSCAAFAISAKPSTSAMMVDAILALEKFSDFVAATRASVACIIAIMACTFAFCTVQFYA